MHQGQWRLTLPSAFCREPGVGRQERPVHAVAAPWRHCHNGSHLTLQHPSFGASRPAPAAVDRYDGQGDRTPLARNLGASSANRRPV